MIFCTIGTQHPFDRLISYLVNWISLNPSMHAIIQGGDSRINPVPDGFHRFIEEPDFSDIFSRATLIVSHAGMGNIIRAMEADIPIVVIPRRKTLREHVNDHQVDTVNSFSGVPNIFTASDQHTFDAAMESALKYLRTGSTERAHSLHRLQTAIRSFIQS